LPRTVNVEARAIRREAFVDVALRLIQTKGYEQMSVQDVLDELEASRGAFYHYFASKIALLEAAVDHIVAAALEAVSPIVTDPGLSAPEKLDRLLSGIAGWKAERRSSCSPCSRSGTRTTTRSCATRCGGAPSSASGPLLSAIIEQGRAEGRFSASSPDGAARAVVALLQGAQDMAGELFFARQAGEITFEVVETRMAGWPRPSVECWGRQLGLCL